MEHESLQSLRREAGFRSQCTVADSLGVDRSTVAKWESGKALPRAAKIVELSKLFNCSVQKIMDALALTASNEN